MYLLCTKQYTGTFCPKYGSTEKNTQELWKSKIILLREPFYSNSSCFFYILMNKLYILIIMINLIMHIMKRGSNIFVLNRGSGGT